MNARNTNEIEPNAGIGLGRLSREQALHTLRQTQQWDVIVIGGGASGLGIAVDAASRGLKTLLLEQADFAKGTSSRSTKLVHGGVRYLAQGDIGLVYSALHERGLLLRNAPHVVKRQAFIIPCYSQWERMKYLVGLKVYDLLAGRLSFGRSSFLDRNETLKVLPSIKQNGLRGAVRYYDGQFDDARLAINLAQTSARFGGVLLNYMRVSGLLKSDNIVSGVIATDMETQLTYEVRSRSVINATGVFVDEVLQMDQQGCKPLVRPSQGIHLVFDRSFLQSDTALMIPKTADGRVLFAVPWHNHVLVGTTDTPLDSNSMEPKALQSEIDFILKTVSLYFTRPPAARDILSIFAGLRPLAAPQKDTDSTKEISRDHKLIVSPSGLITITGGKWTTYRKMAEETVNRATEVGSLKQSPCITSELLIHGSEDANKGYDSGHLAMYGSDAVHINKLAASDEKYSAPLVAGLPYVCAEVVWAVRNEMARTVEDVLARRLRLLFLDAAAAVEAAEAVARLIAAELGRDDDWIAQQLEAFNELAESYLPATGAPKVLL